MNKWSKVDFRRQTKEWWPLFFKCVRNVIVKAAGSGKYMRNNSSGHKGKKNQLYNIKVSSTTVWRYMTNKGWKALNRKRLRTCGRGVRRISKLYSKGRPAGKLTWCELSRDHLDYRWRDTIQRSSPKNTGRAKRVNTLHLEKCFLDTLWELVHSIPHHLENVRKHNGRHFGY